VKFLTGGIAHKRRKSLYGADGTVRIGKG